MVKLKIKSLKLNAGRPVAILHKEFAEKSTIHPDDRILIEKKGKKIAAVVDIATGILKKNEVAVSDEIIKAMKLKEGSFVNIENSPKPESLNAIYKKLACKSLNKKEINEIMNDIVKNKLTEAEIAYFIAGIYKCGMPLKEIAEMTSALVNTGKKLKFKGKVADKHSIGGIPGRTTPVIVSICSSLGLFMPKTSSRAITTASGTADAMEVLCKVDFSLKEMKMILKKTNACLVWGGSLNIAPADDKIIQVERLLNLDPEAQLLASIIAKKLAVDADYVLIDIPYGKNAKVQKPEAERLKTKFMQLGKHFHIKIECFLQEVKEPLGNGIGPALEISDVIKVLRGESCHKLKEKSLVLSGKLLELTGKAKKGKGFEKAKQALESGSAYKKFKEIVKAQKGEIKKIKTAKYRCIIKSKRNGKVQEIKIRELNQTARFAGCPADKKAGIYLYKHLNDKVKKSEKILTIYSESKIELREAVNHFKNVKPIVLR